MWIDSLGQKPDLDEYYERISNMYLDKAINVGEGEDEVAIEDYLRAYDTPTIRFNALVALTDMATYRKIKIIRDGANGPIRSFRNAFDYD